MFTETRLSRRTETRDGFTLHIDHVLDECPDLSYLTQEYEDIAAAEAAKYRQADETRLQGYHRGKWHMVGVCVSVLKQTSSNWADGGLKVGRASVWGIESDSGADYFAEVEADMIAEAFAEVNRLRAALCGNN